MEFIGLFLGIVLALLVARLIRGPATPPPSYDAAPRDPVARLCAELRGDPIRDRPTLNRILALGPGVIPALIDEAATALKSPDDFEPRRHARLCEVIADFGLAAVGPVSEVLARLQPTAPLAPSLTVILRHLGQPGAEAFLRRCVGSPSLTPYVARFRWSAGAHDPARAVVAALRRVPAGERYAALDVCAGILAAHPSALDGLWTAWDEGQVVLLDWMADWLPVARPELVRAGLESATPAVALAAARLAALLPTDQVHWPAVRALLDGGPDLRRASLRALEGDPDDGALRRAAADPEAQVRYAAWATLAERGRAPTPHAEDALLERFTQGGPEPLLAALEDDRPDQRQLAIRLLARHVERDPRARERLIRLAEAEDPDDRVAAVAALARANDREAPDLLARALRSPPTDRGQMHRLQRAGQRLGEAAALPLARRIRADPPGRLEATLAVLRATPYASAVAPLLRGLEDVRSGATEGLIAATVFAGGPALHAAVHESLAVPARGLLAPALRYLATFGAPEDVPLLIELFDRHLPLRSVILNLIETQGLSARDALRARVDEGGDDTVLVSLEQRLALLDAYQEGVQAE